jgi:hypothetical protein
MPATILDALATHLINAGVARSPRTAGSLPPVWRSPVNGVPAPGEGGNATEVGADAVLALFLTGGIASGLYETWMERPVIDVWARTTTSPKAIDLLKQVRTAVVGNTPVPAVGFDLGGVLVIAAQEWRPVQPILPTAQGVWTYTWSVMLQLYSA